MARPSLPARRAPAPLADPVAATDQSARDRQLGHLADVPSHPFEHDIVSRVPRGRIGTADEAAAVALFLLSDGAAYVTASQYPVDGGLTKRQEIAAEWPCRPGG